MTAGTVLALDVGGSKIAGALFGPAGMVRTAVRPTPGPAGAADPGSATLTELAADLLTTVDGTGPVEAIGVGFCEYVHHGRLTSREVIGWEIQPAELLAALAPGIPVRVDSDVRCGLLAEVPVGTGGYVSWGTGLSSALRLGGEVWRGVRGRAIAVGELPAPDATGTLEQFVSGAGMAARYGAATGEAVVGRTVLERAGSGSDPVAASIAESAGRALADALAGLVAVTDPGELVLGGGLGCCGPNRAQVALRSRWAERGTPAWLRVARYGRRSSLVGAAVLAGWRPPVGFSRRCGTGRR